MKRKIMKRKKKEKLLLRGLILHSLVLHVLSYTCMYWLVPLVTPSCAKLHLHILAYTLEHIYTLVLQSNPHGLTATPCC